jgi:dTMP kinase
MIFIVLEGLDGAGGGTQTKRLVKFLHKHGRETVVLSYPNPKSPIGRIIYDYLNKKAEFSADVQMSLYGTDMALDREKIQAALQAGKVVVADRYYLSTLAYQCGVKGVPLDKGLEFAKLMQLPVPDVVIYLDVRPETSIKRKSGENKTLDRHEEDKALLTKVRDAYKKLAKANIFAKEWITVDAEKGIQQVAADIQKIVMGRIS